MSFLSRLSLKKDPKEITFKVYQVHCEPVKALSVIISVKRGPGQDESAPQTFDISTHDRKTDFTFKRVTTFHYNKTGQYQKKDLTIIVKQLDNKGKSKVVGQATMNMSPFIGRQNEKIKIPIKNCHIRNTVVFAAITIQDPSSGSHQNSTIEEDKEQEERQEDVTANKEMTVEVGEMQQQNDAVAQLKRERDEAITKLIEENKNSEQQSSQAQKDLLMKLQRAEDELKKIDNSRSYRDKANKDILNLLDLVKHHKDKADKYQKQVKARDQEIQFLLDLLKRQRELTTEASKPKEVQKPIFGYWKIRGLGASIRYQLAQLGVDYEMKYYEIGDAPGYDYSGWAKDKYNIGLPFPNLPYYIDGDVKLTETIAIHQYLARKYKPELLGKGARDMARVDMVFGPLKELKMATVTPQYLQHDKNLVIEAFKEKIKPILPFMGNNQYLIGDYLTYVDYYFFELLDGINYFWDGKLFTEYPQLDKFYNNMRKIPGLTDFFYSEENQSLRLNNKMAKQNNVQKKLKLGYWGIRGLGAQLRYQLAYCGVDFENKMYTTREEWMKEKFELNLPFPNLPYVIDGETFISETKAIHQYIAKKYKPELLGKTEADQARVEMFLGPLHEFKQAVTMPCYRQSTSDKTKVLQTIWKDIKPLLAFINGNKFVIGDYVTYLDFYWFELLELISFLTEGQIYREYPSLQSYHVRMAGLPNVGKFFHSDQNKGLPLNFPIAKMNNDDVLPKPTFGYWKIRGNGSQIRYQLAYCGVKFNDVMYEQGEGPDFSREEWNKVKWQQGLPFPNLPYYKDGEVFLTETNAIHQYIARKYKPELLGKTPADKARVEMFNGPLSALKWAVTLPCYMGKTRQSIVEKIQTDIQPLIKFIGDNEYVIGDYVTYVDFYWFELLELMNFIMEGKLYEQYPKLHAYHVRFAKLPGVNHAFYSKENQSLGFNNKQATLNNKHQKKIKLGYWAIRGLGAQLRYQMAYCGVDYENKMYTSREEWMNEKFNLGLPFPNLPYVIDGDAHITETKAIHQYIAKKFKPELLGKTQADQGRIEMFLGPLHQFKSAVTMPCYMSGDKQKIAQKIKTDIVPILKFIGDNKFVIGDYVTYVDFYWFEFLELMSHVTDGNIYKQYPSLHRYHKRMASLPGLVQYFHSEENKSLPLNGPTAKININIPKPKLGYWKIRGNGVQMRYQLAYCGVDYENVYFEQDENHSTHDWLKHKFNLGHPFPNLPHFIDGDVKLSETNAVHQYIARKYKPELLGKTPADQARIEMFLGPLGALKWGVTIPCYTTGDREAITAKIRSDIEPLLKFIGDNQYVVGDYVTYVDFYWFELLELMNFVMEGKFYSEYPKMREYHLRMVKLPGFGQFFYSDEVQKMSFNNKHAKLNNHEVVPEFGYWNLRGRGAQIRHQLAWLGVKYTNKEYEMPIQPDLDRSAWLDHKHSVELPFTNLPYFKDGEAKLTETIAIMQYICRKYCPEMLGKDAADQGRAEMIYPQISEIQMQIIMRCFRGMPLEGIKTAVAEKLKVVYKFMGENEYLVGNYVTYVDFFFFEIIDGLQAIWDEDLFLYNPELEAYHWRMLKNEKFAAHYYSKEFQNTHMAPPFAKYNSHPEKFTPKLGYWNIRGLGVQLKLQLAYCHVDYEDVQYKMGEAPHFVKEHWIKEKVNMDHPFKQLPYFIDGPVKLSEYRAIHYYIAKKYKPELLGKTPGDMGKVDMAQNIIHEFNFGMRIPCFTQDSHEHVQNIIQEKIVSVVNFIGDKNYVIGDYITVCDFVMVEALEFASWIWEGLYDAHPKMKAYYERMVSIPEVNQLLNSDACPKQFLLNSAKINNHFTEVEIIKE